MRPMRHFAVETTAVLMAVMQVLYAISVATLDVCINVKMRMYDVPLQQVTLYGADLQAR